MTSNTRACYVCWPICVFDDVAVRNANAVTLAVDGVWDTATVHVAFEVEQAPDCSVNALALIVAQNFASCIGNIGTVNDALEVVGIIVPPKIGLAGAGRFTCGACGIVIATLIFSAGAVEHWRTVKRDHCTEHANNQQNHPKSLDCADRFAHAYLRTEIQ